MNTIELIKVLINTNLDAKINIKSIYIKDNDIDITISNVHELGEVVLYGGNSKEYNLRIGS